MSDYSRADVLRALREVGLREGDVALTHSNVGMLGRPAEGLTREALRDLFASAFREVLGPEGTWILPAFTYSYPRGEPFDPAASEPGNMGVLTEMLWREPGWVRSLDPIFSLIANGPRAEDLMGGEVTDCFGADSPWARIAAVDGAIVNVGLGSHSTLIHHVEQRIGVGYRYPKPFAGTTLVDGEERRTEVVYYVRDLDEPRHEPYFMRLDADARERGAMRSAQVGRGEVNLIRVSAMAELIEAGLARDPEYLVLGDLAGWPIG